ncbi:MAG TPA: STAS domain-containing protein [Micromonosporaceae bacterium]|jgi:anti-anti-sigma factor
MALSIEHRTESDLPVLVIGGDLDLASVPALNDAGAEVLKAGARHVIADISAVSFCDSSGLSAFVRIANALAPRDGRLAVAGPQPIVRRVLEISGLVDIFLVTEDVAEAAAELSATRA